MTNSEKKKIVIGSLRQETNSFSPVITYEKDFLVCRGRDVLQQTPVSRILEEAGFEVVPTLWAYAIPSGKVDKKAYCRFKEIIMNAIPKDGSVAGVWLYLHGAMNVTEIGSGEGPLVEEVRRLVGPKVPIAVALDFPGYPIGNVFIPFIDQIIQRNGPLSFEGIIVNVHDDLKILRSDFFQGFLSASCRHFHRIYVIFHDM
jgi:hypothetical protein